MEGLAIAWVAGEVDTEGLAGGGMEDLGLARAAMAVVGDRPEVLLLVGVGDPDPLDARHGGEVDTAVFVGLEGIAMGGLEVFVLKLEVDWPVGKGLTIFAKDIQDVLAIGKMEVWGIKVEGFLNAVNAKGLGRGKVVFAAFAEVLNLGGKGELQGMGFGGDREFVEEVRAIAEFLDPCFRGRCNTFVIGGAEDEADIFQECRGDLPPVEPEDGTDGEGSFVPPDKGLAVNM